MIEMEVDEIISTIQFEKDRRKEDFT